MIPHFNEQGVLPPGDYEVSISELKQSFLVSGNGCANTWDSQWRMKLVDNLDKMVGQLWSIGITEIYIDGSFVEDKDHPNDIDGYFICELDFLHENLSKLNQADPHSVWTWHPSSRREYKNYPKKQLPMWHIYRVELFPHFGRTTGLKDEFGNDLQFPAAFRRSRRDGSAKGILKIKSLSAGGGQ